MSSLPPEEFIERALAKRMRVEKADDNWPNITPDESFWVSWCAEHRSNSLASQIQSASNTAEAEVQQIRSDTIKERKRAEGVFNTTCQWSGCINHALVGRALGGSCILEPEWSPGLLLEPFMNLRPVMDA